LTVVVFAGPSRPKQFRTLGRCVIWRPPVAAGDVIRALQLRPKAIVLIDGLLGDRPAVRHKEILFAMSEGHRVFGAASMGALRAAELAPYGMQGVGLIYQDFRSGRLIDDDEVVQLHGPAEMAYRPLTEALVNVRATLRLAAARKRIAPALVPRLITAAKRVFFHDRTFEYLALVWSMHRLIRRSDRHDLAAWLSANRVDQKRKDAELAVSLAVQVVARKQQVRPVRWRLERTEYLEALLQGVVQETDQGDLKPPT
jgi:hypothetical protein